MSILNKIPEVSKCCGCVTDLKTAAAIIAVLGIVTSPALSWAVVRHAYVIRVSCFVSSSATRPDVVDINLSNVLSFGFGANAGLGPSCLARNVTKPDLRESDETTDNSPLVDVIKYCGWIVLLMDLIFLLVSVHFLIKMFRGSDKSASKIFMITALLSIILSFIYGMLFVGACMYIGGSFPIFEFFFSLLDLIIWVSWIHFLWVLWSYYHGRPQPQPCFRRFYSYFYDLASSFGISSIHRISIVSRPQCKTLYKYQNPVLIVLTIFLYLFFILEILLLSSGFALLLCIFFKPIALAADIYISCAVLAAIISIIFASIQLLQGAFADCGFQAEVLNFVVYFIMWTYFVLVMNTFRDEMDED